MNIALIGANGQLATELQKLYPQAELFSHREIEISDPQSVWGVLNDSPFDVVINTAAYNLVDLAETNAAEAFAVNRDGPRHLANWCLQHGAQLVHLSTDYVFGSDSNRKVPYVESDEPGPINVYGHSKLAGEREVQSSGVRHLILRTSGLYGRAQSRAKGNFVSSMIKLAQSRSELRVVANQWCSPSSTSDVAMMIKQLLDAKAQGLFHVTNTGGVTWADFAKEIFRLAQLPLRVIPIGAEQFPTAARRPSYSVLDCTRAENTTGHAMPSWQIALQEFLIQNSDF